MKEATVTWDELALREEIVETFADLGVGGVAAEMEERLYRHYQARIRALRERASVGPAEEQAAETAPPRQTFQCVTPIGALGHVTIRETAPLSLGSIAARLRLEHPVGPGTHGFSADALAAEAARFLAKDDRTGGAS
jgi:hypothetical protein